MIPDLITRLEAALGALSELVDALENEAAHELRSTRLKDNRSAYTARELDRYAAEYVAAVVRASEAERCARELLRALTPTKEGSEDHGV